jgi:hypothetical protein
MIEIEEARIARQSTNKDPQELRIRNELEKLISTSWSKEVIRKARKEQENFFKFSFSHLQKPQEIPRRHRELLAKLNKISGARIVAGEEYLDKLKNEKGIIIVTNHFGIAKLTRIDNSEDRFPIPIEVFEPFPLRYASLFLVSERLGGNLYETAIELPGTLNEIQEACGALTIPPVGEKRTETLIKKVEKLVEKDPGAVMVMYPEGGTTGKRNNGGPYDLGEFHSGAFVVSAKTRTPILPVCQAFNPEKGFEVKILEPIFLEEEDLGKISDIVEMTKASMQSRLLV